MSAQVLIQEKIRKMEDDLKRLKAELDKISPKPNQFETIDTAAYLTEVYNG